MNKKRVVDLKDVENILACLPGVQKVAVVVNDWGAIEEIHILTGLKRNPKQIVRDVQSALKAQWDITVDRRKVSIAQIKTPLPRSPGRLCYASLEVKTDAKTRRSEILVTLERDDEDGTAAYVGKALADGSEGSMLFSIARATCTAVNLTIEPSYKFFADDVTIIQVGLKKAVAALVGLVTPKRSHEELLGAALVRREPWEACVRATLDALNRRHEVLPRRGSVENLTDEASKSQAQFRSRLQRFGPDRLD